MSSFLSGALGAIVVLLAVALVRIAAFRRWRRGRSARARLLRRHGACPLRGPRRREERPEVDATASFVSPAVLEALGTPGATRVP